MSVYVVGHKNPDTDSIVSAIAVANLKLDSAENYIPARTGEINKETKYVLERFNLEIPQMLPEGEKRLVLVDHNNPNEGPDDLKTEEITAVIDHHKLVAPVTNEPVLVQIWPVGSTPTMLLHLFKEGGVEISKDLAGAMIATIISDTLNLSSPTTTEKDRKAIVELNEIAGVDLNELADEMFKAKSDISDISTEELLKKDYKVFEMGGKKVGIGVWETVLPQVILSRKTEILEKLSEIKSKDGLDFIFFYSVDILNTKSDLYIAGEGEEGVARGVYSTEIADGVMELPGVVSRKKQMTPLIEKYLLSQ